MIQTSTELSLIFRATGSVTMELPSNNPAEPAILSICDRVDDEHTIRALRLEAETSRAQVANLKMLLLESASMEDALKQSQHDLAASVKRERALALELESAKTEMQSLKDRVTQMNEHLRVAAESEVDLKVLCVFMFFLLN